MLDVTRFQARLCCVSGNIVIARELSSLVSPLNAYVVIIMCLNPGGSMLAPHFQTYKKPLNFLKRIIQLQHHIYQITFYQKKMNILHFLITIILLACNFTDASRLGGKGNLRGLVTKYSGLSPIQIRILRRRIMREQKILYGRFA